MRIFTECPRSTLLHSFRQLFEERLDPSGNRFQPFVHGLCQGADSLQVILYECRSQVDFDNIKRTVLSETKT